MRCNLKKMRLKIFLKSKLIMVFIASVLITTSCVTAKNISNDDRTEEIELIDGTTYFLTQISSDNTYGLTPENPVKVGGIKENQGPINEQRFLNALIGPEGEDVNYIRTGSCCSFETPNGLFGNTGLMDTYKVFYEGSSDTVTMYLNMYDFGNLFVPVGFQAKEP